MPCKARFLDGPKRGETVVLSDEVGPPQIHIRAHQMFLRVFEPRPNLPFSDVPYETLSYLCAGRKGDYFIYTLRRMTPVQIMCIYKEWYTDS